MAMELLWQEIEIHREEDRVRRNETHGERPRENERETKRERREKVINIETSMWMERSETESVLKSQSQLYFSRQVGHILLRAPSTYTKK